VKPRDIPKVGRFSVIADPQGAVISIFKPLQAMTEHDSTKPGEFSWRELYAQDYPSAFRFYQAMFGWQKMDEMDMGEKGKYLLFGDGKKQYGGMMTIPPGMKAGPMWTYYANVDDVESAVERAKKKGADLMVGPMNVPGGTRVAILTDPQGAMFAVHGPGK
jgi:uncharacterized protein